MAIGPEVQCLAGDGLRCCGERAGDTTEAFAGRQQPWGRQLGESEGEWPQERQQLRDSGRSEKGLLETPK